MEILPIKTRKLLPPKDDLFSVLDESIPKLQNKDILFVTSKVVSIHHGRCLLINEVKDKDELVRREADAMLKSEHKDGISLGIKHRTINPFAGLDESNGDGYYILLPEDPSKFAKQLHKYLTTRFNLVAVGVVVVDSVFLPMRAGSVGISLGFAGFEPLRNYDSKQDIFGRELEMSSTNIVDSLAATAGIYFGEGSEQTPIILMRDIEKVEFTNEDKSAELTSLDFDDVFYAFLKLFT